MSDSRVRREERIDVLAEDGRLSLWAVVMEGRLVDGARPIHFKVRNLGIAPGAKKDPGIVFRISMDEVRMIHELTGKFAEAVDAELSR